MISEAVLSAKILFERILPPKLTGKIGFTKFQFLLSDPNLWALNSTPAHISSWLCWLPVVSSYLACLMLGIVMLQHS